MNMKKTIGICATLLAALLCAVPQSAQATGKIRTVDVYDPDGLHSFPNAGSALTVGDKIRVRFRMVNVHWANTVANPSYTNPWEFLYMGSLTGNVDIDELLRQLSNKPRLGLWISGRVREAVRADRLRLRIVEPQGKIAACDGDEGLFDATGEGPPSRIGLRHHAHVGNGLDKRGPTAWGAAILAAAEQGFDGKKRGVAAAVDALSQAESVLR